MVKETGSVVALGNFDGLHKGHRRVIKTAIEKAQETGLQAVVLLFNEHPCRYLGYPVPPRLMTRAEQKRKIEEMGARWVEIDFPRIMNMECEQFVEEILINELNAKTLCCGFNYHFGKGGKGNAELLAEIAEKKSLELLLTEPLCYKGRPISSSRIRECIVRGNMREANDMLGETFGYECEVMSGDRIGRSLGAPTINQYFEEDFIIPLNGVYASKTYVGDECYYSITNVGIRPTLNKKELRSETYIIGYSGDLYGRKIRVELRKYIRSEKKFNSLDELKQQIQTDCKIAKSERLLPEKVKVKAIFFDFDDTLQSKQSAYRSGCEAFIDKYFPEADEDERERKLGQLESIGCKAEERHFSELIALWGWENHPPVEELCGFFNSGKHVSMLPYALDVLEEIKQRGYTLGIISNGDSDVQNAKLDTAGISDMFDIVTVSGDLGVNKPDRFIFDEACRQSGYENGECLFVGNHPVNDIKGALGADMKVVRMNQGDYYNKDLESHIPTIDDLRDLLEII